MCLCSPAVSLDKQSVKQQVKKLEKRFSDLVDFVYRALLRKNTEDNVRYFRSSFLSLDVSRKQEHHKFIHEQSLISFFLAFWNRTAGEDPGNKAIHKSVHGSRLMISSL